jgi:hypothetical protein
MRCMTLQGSVQTVLFAFVMTKPLIIAALIGGLGLIGLVVWFFFRDPREDLIGDVVLQYLAGLQSGWTAEKIENCIAAKYGLTDRTHEVPTVTFVQFPGETQLRLRICQITAEVLRAKGLATHAPAGIPFSPQTREQFQNYKANMESVEERVLFYIKTGGHILAKPGSSPERILQIAEGQI